MPPRFTNEARNGHVPRGLGTTSARRGDRNQSRGQEQVANDNPEREQGQGERERLNSVEDAKTTAPAAKTETPRMNRAGWAATPMHPPPGAQPMDEKRKGAPSAIMIAPEAIITNPTMRRALSTDPKHRLYRLRVSPSPPNGSKSRRLTEPRGRLTSSQLTGRRTKMADLQSSYQNPHVGWKAN